MQQELSHLEQINNLKTSYQNIKQFLDQTSDAISNLIDILDLNDIALQKAITADVLEDVVNISIAAFNQVGYLKQEFLDNGLRELSVLDPALNDGGKMSAAAQNQLANQMIREKLEEVYPYLKTFLANKTLELSEVMPDFLRSLNVDNLRELDGLTIDLYSALQSLVSITIEDFLLQCKAELGIEFEKI